MEHTIIKVTHDTKVCVRMKRGGRAIHIREGKNTIQQDLDVVQSLPLQILKTGLYQTIWSDLIADSILSRGLD